MGNGALEIRCPLFLEDFGRFRLNVKLQSELIAYIKLPKNAASRYFLQREPSHRNRKFLIADKIEIVLMG